jgi:hypothetical protein
MKAVALVNLLESLYRPMVLPVELEFFPMCPDPVIIKRSITVPRVQLVFGKQKLLQPHADVVLTLCGSEKNITLDLDAFSTQNVASMSVIVFHDESMMLLINVTDHSRGATANVQAHAYAEGLGNPGVSKTTLTLPPLPHAVTATGSVSTLLGHQRGVLSPYGVLS